MKEELTKRNFIDYYRGVKGPFIFVVSTYLMIVLILLYSLDSWGTKANIGDFLLVIIGFTLLIAWMLYWEYAEHRRIIDFFERSGVFDFLNRSGFQVKEEKTGWSYELYFQRETDDLFLVISVSKRRGIIWSRYYLDLLELREEQSGIKHPDNARIKENKTSIRLTPGIGTKLQLEEHLNGLISDKTRS